MWAAGCVLYTILCGYQPFYRLYASDLIELIKSGSYDFDSPVWNFVSDKAKALISALLSMDPERRPRPAQALCDEWFDDPRAAMSAGRDSQLLVQNNLRKNQRRLTKSKLPEVDLILSRKRLSFNQTVKGFYFGELDLDRSYESIDSQCTHSP